MFIAWNRRRWLTALAFVFVTLAASCSSDQAMSLPPPAPPPSAPPASVSAMAGSWRYDASFAVPLYVAGSPDTLKCDLSGAMLTLSPPELDSTAAYTKNYFNSNDSTVYHVYSWNFAVGFAGGSIACSGGRGESFVSAPSVGGLSTNLPVSSSWFYYFQMDYALTTPIGQIRICNTNNVATDGSEFTGRVVPSNGPTSFNGSCEFQDGTGSFLGSGTFTMSRP